MYRLLNFSRTQWCKNSGRSFSSINSNSGCSVTEKTCHLCKQLINVTKLQKRLQSTKTNPQSAMKPKKARPRKAKNYAEIVMVTDTASTEGKARVRKLSSTDVKLLADTNLNLSEVYKLKQITTDQNAFKEHTYNNLAIFDNLPSVAPSSSPVVRKRRSRKSDIVSYKMNQLPLIESNICDSEFISSEEHDIDIHNLPLPRTVNTFQPEEVPEEPQDQEATELEPEPKEAPNNRLKMKMDAKHRQEIASKSLAAYNEVCSALKTPHRGLNAMYFHRNRTRRSPNYLPIKNVNVYNALLKGFASRGSYDKVQEILGLLRDEQISLNLQSYIAIFECLGRINIQDNHLKDIRIFVKAAVSQGFTFNQMLNSGSFLNNDREFVIAAMKSYNPDFVPEYKHPQVQYKNHLLNHLNSDKQKNANSKRERNSTKGFLSADKLSKLIDEQIASEKSGYVTVKSIENKGTPSEEVLTYRATLDNHYKMWEESAQAGFVRDLATLTAQRSSFSYEPYIRSIPIKDFIAIIIDEAKYLTQGSETYSPTVNMLYRDLGNKVYARYKVLRKQKTGVLDKICSIHNNYCKSYASDHDELGVLPAKKSFINPRQKWQWNEYRLVSEGATLSMDHQEWTPAVLQHIGKFLYHIVMHDLKIDVNSLRNSKHKNYLPAFYTIFRTQGRLVKEEVKPHPILSKLYRASVPETLTFPTYELPMRCPPIPWISIQTGGYLVSPCDVVRLPFQASTQKQRLSEGQVEQLFPSFDALNQLAAVPWKVNKSILDVILKVFTDGGSSKLDVPEPPTALPRPPAPSPEMDKGEKYQLFRQRLQYRRKKAEMYSLWCDCLYRLSLANHFRDDTFWLPHNMDFRGRVYPVPPHLNHLGSDLARSMLVFAEARPLGPEGLNWLKIHLINLTGLKKRDPISERLKYADEIMETILDSADKPLTGKMWWSKSDEPWQTLACCMEIAAASRSEKPEEFRSHFPIHQDGSCNGLQHYAALGRDSAGAHSVNLTPSEIPQDVYSAVVALVEERRAQDAENGMEIAKTLEGFVKRKVIKQTIMTTVYGVTRFGARLQIARQLKDLDDFPKDSVWSASSYLTGRTFESLATMFTSTREIQDWFTDCARLISSVGGQQVEWVTPLGLPIVQPYFRFKKLSGVTVYDTFSIDKFEKPNVMKQKNAFPPNFIHSLDSCHMMLTSLHCERAGITFVSVHDCYWTHPSTVKIMNKICRDQFVALHSEPILEDLSMFLSNKYSYSAQDFSDDGSVIELTKKKLNRILRQLPKTGNFDIKQVLQSIYFFS